MCYYYCIGLSTISVFCVIFCILWAFLHLSTFALSFVTVTICRVAIVTVCTYPNGVLVVLVVASSFFFFFFLVWFVFSFRCCCFVLFFVCLYIMKEKLEIMSRYLSYLTALETCCKIVLDYCNCVNNWNLRREKEKKKKQPVWENLPALKCCAMLVVLKCYFFNSEKIFFSFFCLFFLFCFLFLVFVPTF